VRRVEHSCCDLQLLYEVRKHCPQALAEGFLRRVRENRPLVYGADNILAAAGFASDDDAMLTVVPEESNRHDDRAEDQPAHQRAAAAIPLAENLLELTRKLALVVNIKTAKALGLTIPQSIASVGRGMNKRREGEGGR
jgi:hypothetical protein